MNLYKRAILWYLRELADEDSVFLHNDERNCKNTREREIQFVKFTEGLNKMWLFLVFHDYGYHFMF